MRKKRLFSIFRRISANFVWLEDQNDEKLIHNIQKSKLQKDSRLAAASTIPSTGCCDDDNDSSEPEEGASGGELPRKRRRRNVSKPVKEVPEVFVEQLVTKFTSLKKFRSTLTTFRNSQDPSWDLTYDSRKKVAEALCDPDHNYKVFDAWVNYTSFAAEFVGIYRGLCKNHRNEIVRDALRSRLSALSMSEEIPEEENALLSVLTSYRRCGLDDELYTSFPFFSTVTSVYAFIGHRISRKVDRSDIGSLEEFKDFTVGRFRRRLLDINHVLALHNVLSRCASRRYYGWAQDALLTSLRSNWEPDSRGGGEFGDMLQLCVNEMQSKLRNTNPDTANVGVEIESSLVRFVLQCLTILVSRVNRVRSRKRSANPFEDHVHTESEGDCGQLLVYRSFSQYHDLQDVVVPHGKKRSCRAPYLRGQSLHIPVIVEHLGCDEPYIAGGTTAACLWKKNLLRDRSICFFRKADFFRKEDLVSISDTTAVVPRLVDCLCLSHALFYVYDVMYLTSDSSWCDAIMHYFDGYVYGLSSNMNSAVKGIDNGVFSAVNEVRRTILSEMATVAGVEEYIFEDDRQRINLIGNS
eukprot:Rmarinus@m.25729